MEHLNWPFPVKSTTDENKIMARTVYNAEDRKRLVGAHVVFKVNGDFSLVFSRDSVIAQITITKGEDKLVELRPSHKQWHELAANMAEGYLLLARRGDRDQQLNERPSVEVADNVWITRRICGNLFLKGCFNMDCSGIKLSARTVHDFSRMSILMGELLRLEFEGM